MATNPSPDADIIIGTIGNDVIDALGGNDTVSGLTGNDDLDGGAGNDTVNGDEGDDILRVTGFGIDTVNGGTDTDTLILNWGDATQDVLTYLSPSANPLGGFNGSYRSYDGRQVDYNSIERSSSRPAAGSTTSG